MNQSIFTTANKTVSLIFTEREAAQLLRVSQPTLRRIRYRSEIGFLRLGTQVRYSQKNLDDYLRRIERRVK